MTPSPSKRKSFGSKQPTKRDKIELSPTGRAKCRACRRKILQGTQRVGREVFHPRHHAYYCEYYHAQCVPANTHLRLGGRSPADELARQHKEEVQRHVKIRERAALRESLRQLRLQFARRLKVPAFIVFHDTTLDDLTVRLPANHSEFLEVHGLGPKKWQSFGTPILQVVNHYRALYANSRTTTRAATPQRQRRSAAAAPTAASLGTDEDDDEVVVAMEALSCEDIVNQKFEHAGFREKLERDVQVKRRRHFCLNNSCACKDIE